VTEPFASVAPVDKVRSVPGVERVGEPRDAVACSTRRRVGRVLDSTGRCLGRKPGRRMGGGGGTVQRCMKVNPAAGNELADLRPPECD